MVKAYYNKVFYGNREEEATETYNTVEDFIKDWTSENFKKYCFSIRKDGQSIFCGKYIGDDNFTAEVRNETGTPHFEVSVDTNDFYGNYKNILHRLDVDGVCWLNRVKDEEASRSKSYNVYKDIITAPFIEKVMKPIVEKINKENNIQYAEEEHKQEIPQNELDKALMTDLTDVLESGEVITRQNPALDSDVRVKRGGMNEGLVHLIDHRIRERVLNKNIQMDEEQAKLETSAVLFLAIDNIDKVPAVKEDNGHFAVYDKGIKTVIGKDKNGRYVVTGYDNNQTKQEATESINAVIAQYGKSPEFLGIYAQVGAVIASQNILPQASEKSTTNKLTLIEVNGIKRELPNGLEAGFIKAVQQNDKLIKEYNTLVKDFNTLADENDKLRQQLQNTIRNAKTY